MKGIGFVVFLVVTHFGVLQAFRLTTWHRYFTWAWPLLVVYAALVVWTSLRLGLAEFSVYQVVLASLWLFVLARHQSRRGDAMLKFATEDANAAQFMAASFARTNRYYAYSAFIYVGALCVSYLVAGARTPMAMPTSSEDPVVRPLVVWVSSLSAMSIITIVTVCYLFIGLMIGADHLSRDLYGAKGPAWALVAWSMLWPFAFYYFKSRGRSPDPAVRTLPRPAARGVVFRSLRLALVWVPVSALGLDYLLRSWALWSTDQRPHGLVWWIGPAIILAAQSVFWYCAGMLVVEALTRMLATRPAVKDTSADAGDSGGPSAK